MVVTFIELINSIFSIVTITVFAIVGIYIASKYLKYKNKTLLLIGTAWFLMGSPWWPSSASFIVYLITGQGLSLQVYLIPYLMVPIYLILFTAGLADLKSYAHQKLLVGIMTLFGIIWYIYYVYFLFTDPMSLGELSSEVDINFKLPVMIYLVAALLITVIEGFLIARESMKSEKVEIALKGKFLLAAFISFLIGAFLDAILPITFITIPIVRILLISSALEFYFGFFLPFWLKRILIKSK